MAKITVPIEIDGFKCIEDVVQAALNYSYKGRTLKEWADSIAEPQTNADRIRSMTDEELARTLADGCHDTRDCPTLCDPIYPYDEIVESCAQCWLEWLRKDVEE